ncbi:uncharacterized protein F5891DRAFT_1200678 [Suillus fuscotomentosus]|uniref:Uncharacterized protein n=1 Tax=Suillus fuscotomentosus TaxID=1912939 RepID=A0AAD4DNR6_9AGAM|nr:uncharacterized protein F5891DRAFT_1200678 [Suillus fuscotomentosus]KAG1886827.1 hypothetical protein F5891DRAFT_1200678 [Suillus fuscotomentosus]
MSQPDTVTTCMGTRPKNATQHPRHILINSHGKKRTTAEKAADDQREREAKEASEKAVQESYQHIATLQAQMQADQDAMCVDAPKPKRPHACLVGKAAKDLKTSDSTMDDRQAGAKIVTNKPLVTKGRGHRGGAKKLAADASIKNPASEHEDGEPVQTKKKKKLVVREAIQAVLNAGIVIDSTKARDGEVQKMSDVSQKFALAGRVPGWLSNLPTTAPKPAASLRVNPSTSSIHPRTSYSKLTKGSTISSNVLPPLTPISTSNAGGFTEFNMYASDEDEDDEELAKPLSHITSNKAYICTLDGVVPSDVTCRSATEQSDSIEDVDNIDIFTDIRSHFIDSDGTGPATQPDFLREYKANDDANHELQSLDRDSDLEPLPLAQKPRSHSTPPMDFDSLASQKWKLSPPLDYDDIMELSSEAKSVQGANEDVKTKPVNPVFTRRVTSTTNVAAMLKAPPAKWLKSESSTPSKPIFIPTVIRCISDLDEVWTLADDVVYPILQSVWNAVYKGKIPHTVEADGPVLAVTLQRLSEWHNTFSNVALAILTNFMTSQDDLKTDEDRKDFASALLEKFSFLFGDITVDGEVSNPFQSDLIVQVLVQHKCATSSAVNLPGTNDTVPGHSRGALSLATAAAHMERTIRLFVNGHMLLGDIDTSGNGRGNKTLLDINPSTGNQSSIPLAFSEANWGAHTRAYMVSITCLPDSV